MISLFIMIIKKSCKVKIYADIVCLQIKKGLEKSENLI